MLLLHNQLGDYGLTKTYRKGRVSFMIEPLLSSIHFVVKLQEICYCNALSSCSRYHKTCDFLEFVIENFCFMLNNNLSIHSAFHYKNNLTCSRLHSNGGRWCPDQMVLAHHFESFEWPQPFLSIYTSRPDNC